MQQKKPTLFSINITFVDPNLDKDFFYENIDMTLQKRPEAPPHQREAQ